MTDTIQTLFHLIVTISSFMILEVIKGILRNSRRVGLISLRPVNVLYFTKFIRQQQTTFQELTVQ